MYSKVIFIVALLIVAGNAASVRTNLRGKGNNTATNSSMEAFSTEPIIVTQPTGKPYTVISDNYGVMDQVRKDAIKEVVNNKTALENLKRLMDNEKKAGCVGCTGKLPEVADMYEIPHSMRMVAQNMFAANSYATR